MTEERDAPPEDGLTRSRFLRRGVAVGSALVLPAGLSACRGSAGSAPAMTAGTTAATTSGAAPATSAGSASTATAATRVDISFFGWDATITAGGAGKALAQARTAWEKANPGSTVTFDGVPLGDFLARATARASSHDLGDVVELLPDVGHAALFGAVRPLAKDDFGALGTELSGWSAAVRDAKHPTAFAGVPVGAQGILWYYNKELFDRAGLDPERPPETWRQFGVAAEALRESGVVPIGMSGLDSKLAWRAWLAFSPQAFPTVADVLAVRSGETRLDDHRFLQTLEPLRESYTKLWWNPLSRISEVADVEGAFAKGQIAMIPGLIAGSSNWQVWDAKLGRDAYGVFPAPRLAFGRSRPVALAPAALYGVGADSRNPATARSWISYLASADGQTALLREAGQFPNRRDVDVGGVTGSVGARAIADTVAKVGGLDVAQNQFSAAAVNAAIPKLTKAITSGNLEGFLADLASLQTVV